MQIEIISKIKKQLDDIKFRYQAKYGVAVFDVKIKNTNNNIILEGIVLAERQKKEAFLAAQEIAKEIKIKNKIRALSDPKEKLEIGWGIVKSGIADIWGIFPDKKKLNKTVRASQAIKGGIARILAEKEKYFLIQTQDLAIGWINKRKTKNEKRKTKTKKLKLRWGKANKAKKNKLFKIRLTNKLRKKFTAFLRDYLYAPYVLGGITELGIDCSGLVQKFYREIFGVLLPRHSADQAEYGEKISLEKARFGDLVFLREKNKKYPHIGIIIEKFKTLNAKRQTYDDILILNARREKGGVAIESAEEILKDYNLINVKRLINFKK